MFGTKQEIGLNDSLEFFVVLETRRKICVVDEFRDETIELFETPPSLARLQLVPSPMGFKLSPFSK
jgi:hypothetical protein